MAAVICCSALLCSCLKLLLFLTSLWQTSAINIPGWNLRQIGIALLNDFIKKKVVLHCPSLTLCQQGKEIFSFVSKLWCFQRALTSTSLHLMSAKFTHCDSDCLPVFGDVTVWVCFCSEQPAQHHTLSAPRFSSKDLKEAQLCQELQTLTVCRLHLAENSLGT